MPKSRDSRLDKFQKLNETFEIAEETIKDIEITIDDRTEVPVIYEQDINSNELITLETLKQDLRMIRSTLLSNTQQGKTIIDAMTKEIVAGGVIDPKLLDGVANLIKSTNGSFKELSSIFKEIQDLEDKKKGKQNHGEVKGDVNNTQNIYVGNASELLDMLSNK